MDCPLLNSTTCECVRWNSATNTCTNIALLPKNPNSQNLPVLSCPYMVRSEINYIVHVHKNVISATVNTPPGISMPKFNDDMRIQSSEVHCPTTNPSK